VADVAQGGDRPPEPPQSALEVVRPPPKGQKNKNKTLGVWGVARPPPWPIWGGSSTLVGFGGGFNNPIRPIWGWLKAFGGGSATPQSPNVLFCFLAFWDWGGSSTPDRPGATPLAKKWGGQPPPWATLTTLFLFYFLGF